MTLKRQMMKLRHMFISDNGGYFSERGCKQRRWKILLTVLKLAWLIPFKRLIHDKIFPVFLLNLASEDNLNSGRLRHELYTGASTCMQ